MTNADEEQERKSFETNEKQLKINYCKSLGLYCEINCPQDRAGCAFHPGHDEAIKAELADYEG